MSVSNGQIANQTTFNNAFMSRTALTTSTVAVVGLQSPTSGTAVTDLQQIINDILDTVGIDGISDPDALDYDSNVVITDGLTHKEVIGMLDAAFDKIAGHDHSISGIGKQISITDVLDINQYSARFQSVSIVGASGSTMDVSSYFTTKTAGGNATTEGVITSAPNNLCYIVKTSLGTFLEDSEGQRVYARLTYSASVWTLSFFTNEAGVETATTVSSTDIRAIFMEVFLLANVPTIPTNPMEFGTLDATLDVVDASTTLRGVMSTGTQSLAGAKTWTGNQIFQALIRGDVATDAATTGANAALPSPAKALLRLTNASLTSIATITGQAASQIFILVNKTGAAITIKNNDAANGILTGTGADLLLPINGSVIVVYDPTSSRSMIMGLAGSFAANSAAIASGAQTKAVVFASAFPDANYALVVAVTNTTDTDPIWLSAVVTSKSASGFTVKFNALTDTANYVLEYQARSYA